MGIEIGIEWLSILLFGALGLLLMLGLPMAFCTGSLAPIFLFVFGIIAVLFDVIYKWLGSLKGGLASATVVACTLLAAMVGVVGATEVTMGMIALPALPMEERVDLREKFRLLRNTIAPILLILLVLGVIFFGVATPVEAAGIGTFGALAVCALHGRLNWINIEDAALATLKATAMVMWIFFGATMFVGFFIVKGGQTFVADLIIGTGLPAYGILFLMMVVLFILGMFLDWVGILLLTVPIFLPILTALTFGGLFGIEGVSKDDLSLWYGVIFMVNMQMAFLSPPFGYSLFYLKSVAPKEITMAMIFKS